MREQSCEGYPFAGVFAVVGQVVRDISIETQFSFVYELQNEKSGELLGHRSNFEFGSEVVCSVPFTICVSERVFVKDLAIAGDEDCSTEIALVGPALHDRSYQGNRGNRGVLSLGWSGKHGWRCEEN